jgi:hypothetical protein
VLDPKPRRATHWQLVELCRWDEADLSGLLIGDAKLAAHRACFEADRELLSDFTIGVSDDVTGVGVDADKADRLDLEARLFLDFADDCLGDALADFYRTAWKTPLFVVGSLL